MASGEFKSLRQAAKARGVSFQSFLSVFYFTRTFPQVAKSTLSDRAKGRHISFEKASQARQTLTLEEEQTLLDWCRQRAQEFRPWLPQELRAHARAISGKEIGIKWNLKFERRHPELLTARPAKLDPKRAKYFNKVIVHDFFDQYEGLHSEYDGIPP